MTADMSNLALCSHALYQKFVISMKLSFVDNFRTAYSGRLLHKCQHLQQQLRCARILWLPGRLLLQHQSHPSLTPLQLPGGQQMPVMGGAGLMMGGADGAVVAPADATPILSLLEAVTPQELADNDEYTDILEDMREECGKVRSGQPFGFAAKRTIVHSLYRTWVCCLPLWERLQIAKAHLCL